MSNARRLADNLPKEGQFGNRNILINGAMNVSQRNGGSVVTVAPSDHYVVDRFKIQDYSDATFTSQQDYDVHDGFTYCSKLTVTGTDTSLGTTQYQRFIQPIEGVNVRHLNWGTSSAKTVTFSFYVNSSLTGTFYVHAFNSAANRSFVSAYTINTANTWEKKIITIPGDQSGTWLTTTGVGIYLGFSLGTGTNFQTSTLDAWQGSFKMAGSNQVNFAGTNGATWKVTGCQLEVGSQASPFEHESYSDTLTKCQRYYQLSHTNGQGYVNGQQHVGIRGTYRTEMRAAPNVTLTLNASNQNNMTGSMNIHINTTHGYYGYVYAAGAGNYYYYYDGVSEAEL